MKHAIKLIPAALLALSMGAQAAVTITMQEVGGDVVVTGFGSIDTLNGAATTNGSSWSGNWNPVRALVVSRGGWTSFDTSYAVSGPQSIGPGSNDWLPVYAPNTNSPFGILGETPSRLSLASDYQLGDPLDFEATFPGANFASLGVANGAYKWTWGTEEDGDSVTLCIGDPEGCLEPEPETPAPVAPTPVPTLGAFGLMGLAGAIGAAGVAMKRRRKQ